ncbi:hypothetical protein Tco_1511496, partial [Tanacetum coccineum]
INIPWKAISERLNDTPTRDTAGNPTAQMNFASANYPTKEELQKNPSSLKRVHFVNSIIILNKKDEAKEEGSVKFSTTKYKDHEITVKAEGEVESDEEFVEETEEETKEEEEDNLEPFDTLPTMKELGYHEWLLKNPRPHGLHYNWIMSNRLEPRRKPSNPKKINNFVGIVRGLKVFIGNFTYKCDFMVLEDTTSVIDHDLESDDDNCEKTHYSDSLDLGPEYKYDEGVCRAIRSLMTMKDRRKRKGEVISDEKKLGSS